MARKLVVEIIGDDTSLRKALDRSSRETKQFQAEITKTGRSMRGVFATAGIGAGITAVLSKSITAASDLAEQMSKTSQVFGASAVDVENWATTTTKAFGVSRREALTTASSFGALFQPMGLTGQKAAEQAEKLTQLGADLASFYNTDVTDALDALRSGIVGESEPLRRYGVLLSETRVQAKALADTHKQSAKELTAAEKAAARIAIIFHDASKASGDFARTSEGLANQSRKLRAELDDLQTNFGEPYLVGVTKAAHAANQAIEAVGLGADKNLAPTLKQQVDLVPRLAREYGRLTAQGYSFSEAVKQLQFDLAHHGITAAQAGGLIGDAINYFAGGASVQKIAKLSQAVHGLGVDAETSAKQMHGLAAATAQVTAATAGGPTGLAALTPAQRTGLALAGARTPAEQLSALRERHRQLMRAAGFARSRLAGAPAGPARGGSAATWATTLQGILEQDSSVLSQIGSIQADNAQKAKDAKQKSADTAKAVQAALKEEIRATKERRLGWLEFAVERAETTKTLTDDRKAWRAVEKYWQDRIRHEGRTLESAREVWRARQKLRDLNKQQADKDPLAGLMQVSSRRLAGLLGAGLGLTPAGLGRLQANISGQEITVYSNVALDGAKVGQAVTRHQSKTAYRTSRQTSGFRG